MNLVYIMSDQHNRRLLGCHGHPTVQTPRLDALAAGAVRFANAYTPCPICVPARASLATGRYVHQIGYWDNGTPYHGLCTFADLPGRSLWPLARGEATSQRTVFGEYHASGSPTGVFMVRGERYKYSPYVGLPPQLFDLRTDPDEHHDLAAAPHCAGVLHACEHELRRIVDPEVVDARAKAKQRAHIEAHGGVEAVLAADPPFIQGTPTPAQFRHLRPDDDINEHHQSPAGSGG